MKGRKTKSFLVQMIGIAMANCPILGYNPVALAYFTALVSICTVKWPALIVMLAGLFISMGSIGCIKYGICMLLVFMAAKVYERKAEERSICFNSIIAAIVTLAMEFADAAMGVINYRVSLVIMLMALIVFSLSVIFSCGVSAFLKPLRTADITNEETVSMGIILLGVTYFICNINYFPVSATALITFSCTILSGYCYGAGMGAIAGACCGMIMGIYLGEQELMGMMCAMGIVSGAFRELGKSGSCIGVATLVAGAGMFAAPFMLDEQWIYGIVAAILLVIIIPKKFILRNQGEHTQQDSDTNREIYIEEKTKKLAAAFEMLADKMEGIPNELSTTLEVVDIYESGKQFFTDSVAKRVENVWESRMNENRQAIAEGFISVSEIIRSIPLLTHSIIMPDIRQEECLNRRLKLNKVKLRNILIRENAEGHYEITLDLIVKRKEGVRAKNIAHELEKVFKRRMIINDGKEWIFEGRRVERFIEEENFMLLHSVARRVKDEQQVSGDNFTCMKLGNGRIFMSISDGMGSGTCAFNESKTVVEMLEKLLESGLGEDVALKLVNFVMILNNTERLATVDMGIINLYSGKCNFLKAGAASTFIKRGNMVECLGSTSMPIGVFGSVDVENTCRKLYDKDLIIMLSDGITDAMGNRSNDKIAELIMDMPESNLEEIASNILNKAVSSEKEDENIIRDDMTVLVAGIWNKG